ncbi:T-cell receptor delta chain, partial [Sigmodon hispidus]
VSSDVILEQVDESLTIPVGNSVIFYCTVTGGDLKNYQMSWYKKNEDNALVLVYKLNSNSTNDLMANFKGKIDISKSQFLLEIHEVTTKDAGTYYCGSDIHSATVLLLITSRKSRVKPRRRANERPSQTELCTKPEMGPSDYINRHLQ